MSAEAIEPHTSGELIALYGPEAVKRERIALHRELGEISARLCAANQDYVECIRRMGLNTIRCHEEGVDTVALANQLQSEQNSLAAINGYGRTDT